MRYVIAAIRMLGLMGIVVSHYIFYRFVLLFKKHTDQRGFRLRHVFFMFVNNNLGIRADMDIRFPNRAAVFVSNHRGLMDWFLLRYLDAFVVAKAEFRKIPVLGRLAQYSGIIYVKRESKLSRGSTRKTIVDALHQGRSILIYPEGTTNTRRTTASFKPGTFKEAATYGFPVVPIAIEYKSPRDYWYENIGTWQMFVRQFGKWRTHCRVRFGPEILSSDPEELIEKSKSWIDEQLLDMQRDWSEVF